MGAISVSSDRVEVQAGAKWVDIYKLLERLNSNQLITGGMCPSVGVAGFTLGGGYSILSRKYGLASDNLISVRMVTANGSKVLFINETVNPDLFWALRGSGGGNYGIVTQFTFKTHTVEYQNYTLGKFYFEAGTKSQQALINAGLINFQLPREIYLDILISNDKELSIWPVYLGTYKEADVYLKPLMDLATQTEFMNFTSYYTLVQEMAKERGLTAPTSGNPLLQSGCILAKLDYSTVDTLFSLDIPSHCQIAFMHIGGAIADIPSGDTAYVNRNGYFDYFCECWYQSKEEQAAAQVFEDKMYTQLHNGGHCSGCYVNDIDRFLPFWQEMYYGDNYQRLYTLKQQWNPVGVGHFHFIQEIGSTYNPG